MSGHNKWSKIKHKKAAEDARKSKVFSKLVRLIQAESRRCSGDLSDPGLQSAIEQAKKENMPKDNIKRAIKRGAGGEAGDEEYVIYETYGPGGVAVVIEALTDNRNRTAPELRHLLSELGYELANPGSATWAFSKEGSEWKAKSFAPISDGDEEKLEKLIEALEDHDDVQKVYTNMES
ncbi:MAG: YebC/PmpR family DNA-binding transcriptional regulator [Candidatus Paceibacterota bacterium]